MDHPLGRIQPTRLRLLRRAGRPVRPEWIARNGKDTTRWPFRLNGKDTLVDVFITVYGEPVETIRRTATAAWP